MMFGHATRRQPNGHALEPAPPVTVASVTPIRQRPPRQMPGKVWFTASRVPDKAVEAGSSSQR